MNYQPLARAVVDNVVEQVGRPFQVTNFDALPTGIQDAFIQALEAVFIEDEEADDKPLIHIIPTAATGQHTGEGHTE